MKAYLLKGIGDFEYTDVEKPSCGQGNVIVKVKAAGICGSDIQRIYGNGAYFYPLIPGHEFSGIVSETGANVDRAWLGKRVGVFPLLPCKKCGPCKEGHYELCRNYGYLGSRTSGGFAEYVSVPVWNLLELPENVSFEQAAMLEPMTVAAHAMRRAEAAQWRIGAAQGRGSGAGQAGAVQGQTVAICGLGTIGLLLYMLLEEKGQKRIYLIGNKKYQEEAAAGLGFDLRLFCNNCMTDGDKWLDETASSGVDVFFDCAGTEESSSLAFRHVKPGGMVILIGNPGSDMRFDRQTYWKILRNQLTIKGSWNSSFAHEKTDDWHYCLDLIARKRIEPEKLISHMLPFDRLAQGMELIRDRKEGHTKVMTIL